MSLHINAVSRFLTVIVFSFMLILPSEVKAIYATKTSMKFIWNEVSGFPEFYNVYVSVDGEEYILMFASNAPMR